MQGQDSDTMGPGKAVIGYRPSDKLWNIPGGPSATDLLEWYMIKNLFTLHLRKEKIYITEKQEYIDPKR